MKKLPLSPFAWTDPDRRLIYRAVLVLTSRSLTSRRMSVASHALLDDLEIYDDPRQHAGHSIDEDEYQLVVRLGETLHSLEQEKRILSGNECEENHWSRVREAAAALRARLEAR